MKLLLIEDDAALCEFLGRILLADNWQVTVAATGPAGLDAARADTFDAVILDRMLPGLDGLAVLRRLRSEGFAAPVLLLTALGSAGDKVEGLDAGADDYLAKPFDLDELLARVSVQLRHASRGAGRSSGTLRFKDWVLDAEARTLTAAGDPVRLTRLEFGIVEALVRRPKKVFTKRELFQAAWNEEAFVEEKAVNVHVSNIRGKLKPSGTDGYIETVWGIGFKLAE